MGCAEGKTGMVGKDLIFERDPRGRVGRIVERGARAGDKIVEVRGS